MAFEPVHETDAEKKVGCRQRLSGIKGKMRMCPGN
jgi:hypothetical protein